MPYPSTTLRRAVLAVLLSLNLKLTAVGGTMAQREPTGGLGGRGGDTVAVSAAGNVVCVDNDEGAITIGIDPPASGTANGLRGKILRITVHPDRVP